MSEDKTHTFCPWVTLQAVRAGELVHRVLQAATGFPGCVHRGDHACPTAHPKETVVCTGEDKGCNKQI